MKSKFLPFIAVLVGLHAQTQVSPLQVRPAFQVIEYATCTGPNATAPGRSCAGLVYFRVRKPDGSPATFVGVPWTDPIDPAVWVWTPIP